MTLLVGDHRGICCDGGVSHWNGIVFLWTWNGVFCDQLWTMISKIHEFFRMKTLKQQQKTIQENPDIAANTTLFRDILRHLEAFGTHT
jgi:hypothetical protein